MLQRTGLDIPRFTLNYHSINPLNPNTTPIPRQQPPGKSRMATTPEADAATASSAPAVIVMDAYTHYAPKALAEYLQECSPKPLVFAKVGR